MRFILHYRLFDIVFMRDIIIIINQHKQVLHQKNDEIVSKLNHVLAIKKKKHENKLFFDYMT
jgi:hypothetical protein